MHELIAHEFIYEFVHDFLLLFDIYMIFAEVDMLLSKAESEKC